MRGPTESLRYRILLPLARAALRWERLWPRLWPVAGIVGLFLGLALMDLLPHLPFWLHVLALVGFVGLLVPAARFAWRGVRRDAASAEQARHRLEIDSGLDHRPLTALDDRIMVGAEDRVARRLWQRHRQRMAAAARSLRLRLPAPNLARHDPLALRAAVLFVLAVGVAVGWRDAPARLERALLPLPVGAAGTAALKVSVWITPPSYTGQAPLFLEAAGAETAQADESKQTLRVPVGSKLLAQVSGLRAEPDLVVGGVKTGFTPIGVVGGTHPGASGAGPSYRVESDLEVPGGKWLSITARGHRLAGWPINVVPDAPPSAEFIAKPSKIGRASLKVEFEARDDYGLTSVALVIRHPKGRPVPGGDPEIRLTLPLASPGAVLSQGTGVHDLSAHPWAGIEVVGRLEATDGRGQVGESEPLRFLLPERIFNHPVARALVEQRRRLSDAEPETILDVVDRLGDLMTRPSHFFNDTVVFLAISIARSKLIHGTGGRILAEVQKLLWDTALRIEDGEFTVAERELMDLQGELMNALRDGRDSAEIERLMDEMRQLLDQYMQALAEHLGRQNLTELPAFDPKNMQTLDRSMMQDMLDQARELARNGAMDAARKLMSQLQQAIQSIRQGMSMSPQQQKALAEAGRLMNGLRKLTDDQRKLLDRTFQQAQRDRGFRQGEPRAPGEGAIPQNRQGQGRQGQEGRQGQGQRPGQGQGKGPGKGQGIGSGEQESLRRKLGDLMLQMDEILGAIPGSLGKAERAMRAAEGFLRDGQAGDAVPHQTEALKQLQGAAQQMSEQLARRFAPVMGLRRSGAGGGRGRETQDPFGRGWGGGFGAAVDGDTKVPSGRELRRARDILQELRRRAGERYRPPVERDYIDRLLRQF